MTPWVYTPPPSWGFALYWLEEGRYFQVNGSEWIIFHLRLIFHLETIVFHLWGFHSLSLSGKLRALDLFLLSNFRLGLRPPVCLTLNQNLFFLITACLRLPKDQVFTVHVISCKQLSDGSPQFILHNRPKRSSWNTATSTSFSQSKITVNSHCPPH